MFGCINDPAEAAEEDEEKNVNIFETLIAAHSTYFHAFYQILLIQLQKLTNVSDALHGKNCKSFPM